MHRPHAIEFSEKDLVALNANAEASFVIDEDAWEDATDESGVDCDVLCHSQWRASTFDSVRLSAEPVPDSVIVGPALRWRRATRSSS
jgi:hypothetical protein